MEMPRFGLPRPMMIPLDVLGCLLACLLACCPGCSLWYSTYRDDCVRGSNTSSAFPADSCRLWEGRMHQFGLCDFLLPDLGRGTCCKGQESQLAPCLGTPDSNCLRGSC